MTVRWLATAFVVAMGVTGCGAESEDVFASDAASGDTEQIGEPELGEPAVEADPVDDRRLRASCPSAEFVGERTGMSFTTSDAPSIEESSIFWCRWTTGGETAFEVDFDVLDSQRVDESLELVCGQANEGIDPDDPAVLWEQPFTVDDAGCSAASVTRVDAGATEIRLTTGLSLRRGPDDFLCLGTMVGGDVPPEAAEAAMNIVADLSEDLCSNRRLLRALSDQTPATDTFPCEQLDMDAVIDRLDSLAPLGPGSLSVWSDPALYGLELPGTGCGAAVYVAGGGDSSPPHLDVFVGYGRPDTTGANVADRCGDTPCPEQGPDWAYTPESDWGYPLVWCWNVDTSPLQLAQVNARFDADVSRGVLVESCRSLLLEHR